jgi:hypothetical protein
MKGKKGLFLFLALLLPVAVFVFLKFFGKNEFEVPLIYANGVSDAPAECGLEYPVPYVLHDSLMLKLRAEETSMLVLDFSGQSSTEMQVVRDEFAKDKVMIKSASSINFADEKFVRECVLLLKNPNEIVLIDSKNQIRGYYQNSREEIDRMILEIKILLKKY